MESASRWFHYTEIKNAFSITTQAFLNSNCCFYMCSTCFDLYLGHPQARKYKSLTNEDTKNLRGPLL
jgi:hypothetical protein